MNINQDQAGLEARRDMLKDIVLILLWCLVLAMTAATIRTIYLGTAPPLWDSLAYQLDGLRILHTLLEQENYLGAIQAAYNAHAVGHVLTLAFGYLMLGVHASSPYAVSAVFSCGFLVTGYLLARELKVGRFVALWGVMYVSILPAFFYQGFMQTRNDIQAACFVGLSWLFLLKAIHQSELRWFFWAGFVAGLGALLKVSVPGYAVWGLLITLMLSHGQSTRQRFGLAGVYLLGAALVSGWYYLPKLPGIVAYYATWQGADGFITRQYGLGSQWFARLGFYPNNIVSNHLGVVVSSALGVVFIVWLARWLYRGLKAARVTVEKRVLATVLAGVLPLVFLTALGSLSSLGDVPVMALLLAACLVMINMACGAPEIKWSGVVPGLILVVVMPFMLARLPVIEKAYATSDYLKFSDQLYKVRKQIGMHDEQMLQVFSHPTYNVSAAMWSHYMDTTNWRGGGIPGPIAMQMLIFPEDAGLIAKKLETVPLLIFSDTAATSIGGEPFHTLNRLQNDIMKVINERERYKIIQSIDLENGRFPVQVAVRKDFTVFRPKQITADNWTEWDSYIEYFASYPSMARLVGVPLSSVDHFYLVPADGKGDSIVMKNVGVDQGGAYIYTSQTYLPSVGVAKLYKLVAPEGQGAMASRVDSRKLAFRNLSTQAQVVREVH